MEKRRQSRAAGRSRSSTPNKKPRNPESTSLSRKKLRRFVHRTLEALPYAHALWEGGSTAFGDDDVWSDLDLQVCVDDDRVDDTFAALEQAFEKSLPVERRLIVPEPTWHGHAQRFYRFRDAPPWLLLDLCVEKLSSTNRLWESEIHGEQPFLFDRADLASTKTPLDADAHEQLLRNRIEQLRDRVAMFSVFVEKEVRRHHPLDAFAFYQAFALNPLVEALRIQHDPWRHDWGIRYLHRCLMKSEQRRLESFVFLRNAEELLPKARAAHRWLHAILGDLDSRPTLIDGATPVTRRPSKSRGGAGQTRRA